MITPFVVSKCANFQVKMFPNTHFFSKKHEFWRIYQCTDLAEKLQASTLLLSKRTNRDVFNAIFKSFLRHIESTLCLFKVTKNIQKKNQFFWFFLSNFDFFQKSAFSRWNLRFPSNFIWDHRHQFWIFFNGFWCKRKLRIRTFRFSKSYVQCTIGSNPRGW